MILIILFVIIMIMFLLCILSDTETFKAIDKKIANRIERKEK